MKFYRVAYSQDGGNSGGFSWHTSRREALEHAREAQRAHPEEYDMGSYGKTTADQMIDECELRPTKAGILRFLRHYAEHADNG